MGAISVLLEMKSLLSVSVVRKGEWEKSDVLIPPHGPHAPWRGLCAFGPHREVIRTHLSMFITLVVYANQCVVPCYYSDRTCYSNNI